MMVLEYLIYYQFKETCNKPTIMKTGKVLKI